MKTTGTGILFLFGWIFAALSGDDIHNLQSGIYRASFSKDNVQDFKVIVKDWHVKMLPLSMTEKSFIKGAVNGTIKGNRFNAKILVDKFPDITGTLIADNTIDAVVSSPGGHAGLVRFEKIKNLPGESERKKISKENLRKIGEALQKLAKDSGGKYPKLEGADLFETLRKKGYLNDVNVLICPGSGTKPAQEDQPISDKNIDYVYYPENVYGEGVSAFPIVWDKGDNFIAGGHVLFSNGNVEWLDGSRWRKHIKKHCH